MGKGFLAGALFLLAGMAHGAADEHARGDFSFRTGPLPAFVERAEIAATWPGDAPGASDDRWRYWLYDLQSDRRDRRDEYFVDYVYEARTPSLVGEAGRFQIEFNPGFQQLTIHAVELRRDDAWQDRLVPDKISLARRESGFEQDLADGSVTALIVLDDVRMGDVVRVAYSVLGSNPVLEGHLTDWMRFGWQNPMLHARLRVLLAAGQKPLLHRENDAPQAMVRQRADATEVVVEARGLRAYIDEEHYPAWYQPYPMVQVGAHRTWKDIVDWALPLYPQVDALPDELEAKLEQWRALPDDRARLTAALRLVQDDVRYFGVEMGDNTHRPHPPEETWRRRFGDCKDKVYLLVTLLSRMQIDAVPALVTTDRGKALAGFVPSASVFNHVIARVEVDGEVLWVDPTITLQGGRAGEYDLADYGAALPVFAGSARIETIQPPRGNAAGNGITVVERYTPQQGLHDVGLEIETLYRGDAADRRRRSFANERTDDLSRRYADYYSKRLGEIEVLALPKIEDDRDGNLLKVTERYRLKSPFDDEGASVRALDIYADALQSTSTLPSSLTRNSPLAYTSRGSYRHEVEVVLPERWTPTFGKERQALASPAFAYERSTELGEGSAKLVYEIDVKASELAPAEASRHLGEVRKLQDSLSATLRFRIPANVSADERQQRLQQLLRNAIEQGKRE
ncbi:MAG: DUF3857 domain-containing protein [Luteimonas sp.]|nr:DUF3857 domain-containing protein [Luteimonas sp.]